jgi:hypothetical protein
VIFSESLGVAMETAICMDGFSVGSISTRHLCASHGFVHSHIMSVSSSDETCSCNHATEIYRVDRQFFFFYNYGSTVEKHWSAHGFVLPYY